MNTDDFEQEVISAALAWAAIRRIVTVDKTAHAIKMRLHISESCFIQVYANIRKGLYSYTLILDHMRIFGRDCDGGRWHRHPYGVAETHDFGPEGARPIVLAEFLGEALQILAGEGIL